MRDLVIDKQKDGSWFIQKDKENIPKDLHFFITNALKAEYDKENFKYTGIKYNPAKAVMSELEKLNIKDLIIVTYDDSKKQSSSKHDKITEIGVVKKDDNFYVNGLRKDSKWQKQLQEQFGGVATKSSKEDGLVNLKFKKSPVAFFKDLEKTGTLQKYNVEVKYTGFPKEKEKTENSSLKVFKDNKENPTMLVVSGLTKADNAIRASIREKYGAKGVKIKDNEWEWHLLNNGNAKDLLNKQANIYHELVDIQQGKNVNTASTTTNKNESKQNNSTVQKDFNIFAAKTAGFVVVSSELIKESQAFRDYLKNNGFKYDRKEGGFVGEGNIGMAKKLVDDMVTQKKTFEEALKDACKKSNVDEDTSAKIAQILKEEYNLKDNMVLS